jgi:hypothetical protein
LYVLCIKIKKYKKIINKKDKKNDVVLFVAGAYMSWWKMLDGGHSSIPHHPFIIK